MKSARDNMTRRTAMHRIARRLARDAAALRWRTPSHVYNPLIYAWPAHREYLGRYGERRGRVLLLVEKAAGLARVARHLGHALLVVVELLQRGDRHIDVVFFETKQARGVVHQHVGVKDEQLGLGDGFSRHVVIVMAGERLTQPSYLKRMAACPIGKVIPNPAPAA